MISVSLSTSFVDANSNWSRHVGHPCCKQPHFAAREIALVKGTLRTYHPGGLQQQNSSIRRIDDVNI
jgi:hypothetical protein